MSTELIAQDRREHYQRIEAIKVAFITKKLDLTTEEAQKYVDAKLSPINYEDRTNWQDNADLEMELMQASKRRLQSALEQK